MGAGASPASRSLGTLLDEVLERDLHLDPVVRATHRRGLPEHVLAHDLAVALHRRHARADARQPAAKLEVRVVLVPQAAFEPPAHARELRRVQRQSLLLRHLHRYRLKLAQPRGAAELPAAGADAPDHLRLVARADLLHLDARVQRLREIADELAKIDATLRAKVEDRLARVEEVLHLHELHAHLAIANARETE